MSHDDNEINIIPNWYFGATLKICKKSKLDRNQLKISKQHKNMYMYQKKL